MKRRIVPYIFLLSIMVMAGRSSAQWTHYDNNADIRAMYERNDTLWVATNGGLILVDLLTDEIIVKVNAGDLLADNSVRFITAYGDSMFIATDGGLSIMGSVRTLVLTPSVAPYYEDVRSVSFSPWHETFIASLGHGVGVVSPDTRRWITQADSLLDNKVYAVAPLDSGDVFFATSLGLCAWLDSAWVSYQAGAGLPRGEVRQLLPMGQDMEKKFYVLVAGRGIYRFNEGSSRRIRLRETFPDNEVATIGLTRNGVLWAGGRFGVIARYGGGQWVTYGDGDPRIDRGRWRSTFVDTNGVVYFGSADGVIARVRDSELTTITLPSLLASGYVGPMIEDNSGQMLVVNGGDLLRWDEGGQTFVFDSELGSVFSMKRDNDGDLWVTTPWGILRRVGDSWQEFTNDIEPVSPVFVSLAFDAMGRVWTGGHSGEVYRFDGDVWIRYAARHELTSGAIDDLWFDGDGKLWAIANSAGAFRYDGATRWQRYELPVFQDLRIEDAAVSAEGRMVVVTARRVWRFGANDNWEAILLPGGAEVGDFRKICFDSNERMFLGTTRGLVIVPGEDMRSIGVRDGLAGRDVTSLYVDNGDNVWVGFRRDGLSRAALAEIFAPEP